MTGVNSLAEVGARPRGCPSTQPVRHTGEAQRGQPMVLPERSCRPCLPGDPREDEARCSGLCTWGHILRDEQFWACFLSLHHTVCSPKGLGRV